MVVGFDIGGTTARVSVFDDDWTCVASLRQQVRHSTEPDEVADLVVALLEELEEEADCDWDLFDAIGIGLAGQLSADGRVVRNSPNLGWRDEPFAERIEARVGERTGASMASTVHLVNDLDASLQGEHSAGAVTDVEEVLSVYVGTGVGGAILSGGRLITGARGVAGEIGHSKIEPGGRLCGCGERGCIEAYAGGIHLERQAGSVADEEGLEEIRTDVSDGETELDVDLAAADRAAAEGGTLDDVWEHATDGLAVVVANACTLLNPAVLLIGGGVLEHCPSFRERFLTKVSPLILKVARDDLEIRRPTLGEEAGMLGAARLASEWV